MSDLVGVLVAASRTSHESFVGVESLICDPIRAAGFPVEVSVGRGGGSMRPVGKRGLSSRGWDRVSDVTAISMWPTPEKGSGLGQAWTSFTALNAFLTVPLDGVGSQAKLMIRMPWKAVEGWSRDDFSRFVYRLGELFRPSFGFVTRADGPDLFTELGYRSPRTPDALVPGYGWFTFLSHELVSRIGGVEALNRLPFSVSAIDGSAENGFLIETVSGPERDVDEFDVLDELIAPIRAARTGGSGGGLLGNWEAMSRLDRALVLEEGGPQGRRHPDPVRFPYQLVELDGRSDEWGPQVRPPLEWWDDPDAGRPTVRAEPLLPPTEPDGTPPADDEATVRIGGSELRFTHREVGLVVIVLCAGAGVDGMNEELPVASELVDFLERTSNDEILSTLANDPDFGPARVAELTGEEVEGNRLHDNDFLDQLRQLIIDAPPRARPTVEF